MFARIGYVIFDFAFFISSLLLMFFGTHLFKNMEWGCNYDLQNEPDYSCIGASIVFRMSASLAVLHFLLIFICLCKTPCTAAFHDGAWPVKFLLVCGLFIASVFLKNNFYIYGIISTSLSILFIFYEFILIFSLTSKWNDIWYEKATTFEGCSARTYSALLLVFTILFTLMAIGVVVYCFLFYKDNASISIIAITLGFPVIQFILTLALPKIEGVSRSILIAATMFAFSSFVTWSALLSNPANDKILTLSESVSQIVIGAVIMLVTLFYTSASTKSDSKESQNVVEKIEEKMEEEVDESEKLEIKNEVPDPGKAPPDVSVASCLFHVLMTVGSVYLAMVLTNWGKPMINGLAGFTSLVIPNFCFWSRVVAAWAANLLYIWVLIAPNVCKNRDFS